ncbi:MAG: carbamoyltransferase C-terminal domain-containing protein, partial [Bacteroidota bacterium]
MKNNHTYCLGIGLGHDGSVCLLKDGKIAFAIEKERLTRVKHDGGDPRDAINYCLEAEGITMEDVEVVVSSSLIGSSYGLGELSGPNFMSNGRAEVKISHHLAHAYSAIGFCNYDDFNILVIDGNGSTYNKCDDLAGAIIPDKDKISADVAHQYYEKDSYYKYVNNQLQPVFKDFSILASLQPDPLVPLSLVHSIGGFYAAASIYCFNGMEDPGKLMGLAPYGKRGAIGLDAYKFENGRAFVNYEHFKAFDMPAPNYAHFKEHFQYYADFASWIQQETEKALLYIVNDRLKIDNRKNLCYAGGVALNAVANSVIRNQTNIDHITMVPAAGDNGISLGCAYYGWLEVLKRERVMHGKSTAFGCTYSPIEIKQTFETYHEKDFANNKKIIEMFFWLINDQKFYQLDPNANMILNFNLLNYGTYQVKIQKGIITATPSPSEPSTCQVTLPGEAFAKGVASLKYLLSSGIEEKTEVSNYAELQIFQQMVMWEDISHEVMEHIEKLSISYMYSDKIEEITAALLEEGKIIGWFQDGSEFGPRALGRRSILADPRKDGVRDFINSQVKFREDFRPFAPSVLREDVSVYFDTEKESPYMILVDRVRPEWKETINNVVHVNGSSRVQTVTEDWNPKYYRLLQEFKKRTGISVLLNTSLNRKGMPIVETPEDALDFFYNCGIDCMIIGNYIIAKEELTALQLEQSN